MNAPNTSREFDRAYRLPFTFWGDLRMPKEIIELARQPGMQRSLELGCGVGRFSGYLAHEGIHATAIDFSPVAIAKAQKRVASEKMKAEYLIRDVTNLEGIEGPFDFSFDVGCFHCLDAKGQAKYIGEVHRVLKPGGMHLIWALDFGPSDLNYSPDAMKELFSSGFELKKAEKSRRRLVASHWYWLEKKISL